MKVLVSQVTSKGQVTIPKELRQLLGIAPQDRVAFLVEDGEIRLARAEGRGVVERTAGSLKSESPPTTAETLREAAEHAIGREGAERANS